MADGTAANKTRSGLTAAVIYDVDKPASTKVHCMFNPYEYTIKKTNRFESVMGVSGKAPTMKFVGADVQKLGIDLIFDTYESGDNLLDTTNKLWSFMAPKGDNTPDPPEVAFKWGSLYFVAVITEMSHHFTLFDKEGIPVRAKVHIEFQQSRDPADYPRQNPTSGGGPLQRVRTVRSGDRLDLIANEEYGDTHKWRLIADYNDIDDPLGLRTGQQIVIPEEV